MRNVAVLAALLAVLAGCGPGRSADHAGAATPTPAAPAGTAGGGTTGSPPGASPAGSGPAGSGAAGSGPAGRGPAATGSPGTGTGGSAASASPTGPAAATDLLRPGGSGPDVLALQQRLTDLGYWLGTPDGRYGASTAHAVTAFQKLAGLDRDGVAGPATRQALARATRPRPRSTTGNPIEVDLARQVVLLVVGGQVEWVLDTSTGRVAGTTPTGQYRIFRQVDGYDPGPLGVLYRPKYFVGGVALHGYPDVPAFPASHGCVRLTDEAMDWLWASGRAAIGRTVWVY